MPNNSSPAAPEPGNEVQVVLSTTMIETVRAPLKPVYVRFAVPSDWYLPAVCAPPDAPPPPKPMKVHVVKMATLKTARSARPSLKTVKTRI